MDALTKSLEHNQAFVNSARDRAVILKQQGLLSGLASSVSFDGGVFGISGDQVRSSKNYGAFRNWLYSAINALAMEGAGQPINLAKLKGKKTKGPGPKGTKGFYLSKMPKSLRNKAAAQEYEVLLDHDMIEVLDKPNEIQNRWQFTYSFIASLALTGWSYIIYEYDKDDKPVIYTVPTSWVRPDHTDGPFSKFYVADPKDPAGQTKEPLSKDNVAFAYLPDPSNILGAVAPASSQETSIQIDSYIQNSQKQHFKQGIYPSVIVTVGKNPHPDVPGGIRPRLSGAQRRQVIAAINKASAGVANHGAPAIVDGLIESVTKFSNGAQEMDWTRSADSNRTRILSVFGVHPYILGEAVGVGGYAQVANIEKRFFKRVNSYLSMLSDIVTQIISGREETDLVAWWEECTAVDQSIRSAELKAARANGDISQNEFRAELGFPPDEDKNEAIITGPMGGQIAQMLGQVVSGAMAPEQLTAFLEGMGLPTDLAERISGKGLPKLPPPGQEQTTPEQQQEEAMKVLRLAIESLKQPLDLDVGQCFDAVKFDPSQPRDDDGRFATGGSSGGGSSSGSDYESYNDKIEGTQKEADREVKRCDKAVNKCREMPNTEHITSLIKIATSALELKQQHRSYLRRAAIHQLHIKQVGATERDLQRVLAPMFQRQIDGMISKLLKVQNKDVNVLRLKYDPNQPRDDHGRFATGGSSGSSGSSGGLDSLVDYNNKDTICESINLGNPKPSSSDVSQIRKYISHDFHKTPLYEQINTSLRNNTKLNVANLKVVEALDRVISDNPSQINAVLYRSASQKYFSSEAEVGYEYTDKGFMSTSSDWTVGADFQASSGGKVMLKINVPKGSPALFVSKTFSKEPSEHEIILPRGTKLQLVSKKKYNLPHRGEREVWEFVVKNPSDIDKKDYHPNNPDITKSISASKIIERIFDKEKATEELIDVTLPILAVRMIEAANNQLRQLGVKNRHKHVDDLQNKQTKATTATDWLEEQGNLTDLLEGLPEFIPGSTPYRLMTELPPEMRASIVKKLRESFNQDYWLNISETTQGDVERILEQGLQEGWSIRDMANAMRESLGGTQYARRRSFNIARTESGGALNGARRAVMDQVQEDLGVEVPMRPTWLSVLGNTTRDSHANLDGVPANDKGLWDLSGYMIPYPAHYSLPPAERCFCQCSLTLEFGMRSDEATQLIQDYYNRIQETSLPGLQVKYDPNQPRIPAGSSDGGQFGTGMVGAVFKNDRWELSNGEPVPEHIPKRIPPAWTHVQVAIDANADLLVKGRDGKGRQQCIYSESHVMRQAALKFSRITELREKQRKLELEIDSDTHSKDSNISENAATLRLINSTGIRPGSDSDTQAEKQAYGATTLEGRHVVVQQRGVRLRFVGKKGVDLDIPVTDTKVAKDLIARKQAAGNKGRLFNTTASKLRDYTHSKDGGSFKPKDFRTAKGTNVAAELVAKMKPPKTTAEYKRAVRSVAKQVSAALGNTPAVALQSYIDPSVFSGWRIK